LQYYAHIATIYKFGDNISRCSGIGGNRSIF
jgi:hypothetical protein